MRKAICSIAFIVCFISMLLTGCGSNIKQTKNTVELGSTAVRLIDLVECAEGISVIVKDMGEFDTTKIGSYDVTFEVTNENGEKKEKVFTFTVVDTIAPEISTGDKLTLIKGVNFNIEELVTATDKSGNVEIASSSEIDTNVPGEYPITVTATDTSGNEASKDIIVTVLERTETNFRNTVWGDSIAMVESIETESKIADAQDGFLFYNGNIAGLETTICYMFDEEYGLYRAGYLIDKQYLSSGNIAISDYYSLRDILTKKYGEPDSKEEPIILSFLAQYAPDDGSALLMGEIMYTATWELPEQNTRICVEAFSSNYEIIVRAMYEDTRYEADYSGDF